MKATLITLLFGAALVLGGCSDDSANPPGSDTESIGEFLSNTSNFSLLSTALDRADLTATLSGTDDFTLLAPNNTVFTAYLTSVGFSDVESIPMDELKQLLLSHVFSGQVQSSAFQTGYTKVMAAEATTSNPIDLYVDVTGGVKINDAVSLTTIDQQKKNGIIHEVDNVIEIPTVTTHAAINPNFSTLVEALGRFGTTYTDILSGNTDAPFTVFAPDNVAFEALYTELGVAGLADIDDTTLKGVLDYHVIKDANVLAASLTQDQEVTTIGGNTFAIDLTNGAEIIDGQSRVSTIQATDIQGKNGVVHVIDKVLLP